MTIRQEAVEQAKKQGLCTQCLKKPRAEHRLQCKRCIDTNRRKHMTGKRDNLDFSQRLDSTKAKILITNVKKYIENNHISVWKLSKKAKMPYATLIYWLKGTVKPRIRYTQSLLSIIAGEEVRQEAIQTKLDKADKKNRIPRAYNKQKKNLPPIVIHHSLMLIDTYVTELSNQHTWEEYRDIRKDIVEKLYSFLTQYKGTK